jgi:exosortase/archaeosortase family protein
MSNQLIINRHFAIPIRKEIYRTAGIFIAATGILWGLTNLPWAMAYLIDPLSISLARIVTAILQTLGEPVYQIGIVVNSPAVNLEITAACSGLYQMVVLSAGILAWPSTARERMRGILLGTLLLMSINMFRIISIYYCALTIPEWVPFFHGVLWEGVMVLLVPFFWIYWVRAIPGAQKE